MGRIYVVQCKIPEHFHVKFSVCKMQPIKKLSTNYKLQIEECPPGTWENFQVKTILNPILKQQYFL